MVFDVVLKVFCKRGHSFRQFFVMILVRKNVYKDVCLLKMFSMFVRYFESVGACFENRKDVCFKIEQVIRSILLTQMSFLCISIPFTLLSYH